MSILGCVGAVPQQLLSIPGWSQQIPIPVTVPIGRLLTALRAQEGFLGQQKLQLLAAVE